MYVKHGQSRQTIYVRNKVEIKKRKKNTTINYPSVLHVTQLPVTQLPVTQ